MPDLMTMEQAFALTDPYHDLYVRAHRKAGHFWWDQYREAFPLAFADASPRGRASTLNDLIVAEIGREVGSAMIPRERLGFVAHAISNGKRSGLVRFKKLDPDWRPRNVATEQQNYLAQQTFFPEAMGQLMLEGISEPPTLLTCGYLLARDEMSISTILIALHYKKQLYYYYDLESAEAENVLHLSALGQMPQSRVRARRRKSLSGTR